MRGQKIVMVGAGAVGGYFGALLCRAGQEVTFLVRPKTAEVLSQKGLHIESPHGALTLHPAVVCQPDPAALPDLIILAVKCTDLSAVLDSVAPWVHAGATLLTLQNGVDSEERILEYFNSVDCVVAGVAYITARLSEPGVIEHYRRGTVSIGELNGKATDRVQKIYDLLSSGIPCQRTSSIQKEKWEKLCWNATFNPLSVILDHPLSLILQSEPLLEIVREGIREIIAVAKAEGIVINPQITDNTLSVTRALADYYTSMYEDYQHKKPTEIEHLNGDILRRGTKHGIPTPINQILYSLIKGLELKQSITKNGE